MNVSNNANLLANLYQLNRRMDMTATVLSTGKNINRPSDDTASFILTERLMRQMNASKSVNTNVDSAKYTLNAMKAGVQSGLTILNNMLNLTIEAQKSTIPSNTRMLMQEQFTTDMYAYIHLTEKFSINGKNYLGSTEGYVPINVGISQFLLRPAYIDYAGYEGVTFGYENINAVSDANAMKTILEKNMQILQGAYASIGYQQKQLDFYEEYNNNQYAAAESAYASIMDANMAKKQSEMTKYRLLEDSTYNLLKLSDSRSASLMNYISS